MYAQNYKQISTTVVFEASVSKITPWHIIQTQNEKNKWPYAPAKPFYKAALAKNKLCCDQVICEVSVLVRIFKSKWCIGFGQQV